MDSCLLRHFDSAQCRQAQDRCAGMTRYIVAVSFDFAQDRPATAKRKGIMFFKKARKRELYFCRPALQHKGPCPSGL